MKIRVLGDAGALELLGGRSGAARRHCRRRLCRHCSSPPPLVGQAAAFEKRPTEPRMNYISVSFSSACFPNSSLQVN